MAASHGNTHSLPTSRSVSPVNNVTGRPYDPFRAPADPLELPELPQSSGDARNTYSFHRAPSPSPSPSERNPPAGSYLPASRGGDGASYLESPIVAPRFQTPWSGTPSIYSIGGLSSHKTIDVKTQALVDKRVGEIAQWNIHWITPVLIGVLFVAGLLAAFGHHIFYERLDGKSAKEQLKMIRYGTALAFFVKSTLVGCIIMCYRQRIWRTFRSKALTMDGIDGLFSATEDPTHFFWNWEMIKNGKLATLMAACSWWVSGYSPVTWVTSADPYTRLIPLASVLSPAALTSELRVINSTQITRCNAASLNFTHESLNDFRGVVSFPGASLIFFNTTDPKGETKGFFDYYDQPSKYARRLTVTAAYLRKPSSVRAPRRSEPVCFKFKTGYGFAPIASFLMFGPQLTFLSSHLESQSRYRNLWRGLELHLHSQFPGAGLQVRRTRAERQTCIQS